ncbi:MAG: trypsin-like peptidase domain-containing protein [Clostridia bacterium]|nr:trypsin-like peptidase domain-containing protein [Clostridia bacterium]
MKKVFLAIVVLVLGLAVLSGCRSNCRHEWQIATCTSPQYCAICHVAVGDPLAHDWEDATCTEAKYCTLCNAKEGEPLDHEYKETTAREASCEQEGLLRYTCSRCSDSYDTAVPYPEYDATSVHELAKNSVGEVTTYTKSGSELALGSCFVYSADGKIVTNYHVIEDAYSAKITLNNTSYTVQSVLAYDKDLDLAVLKITASDLTPLKICSETHAVGKQVYAFGSSRGMTATFSQGIITYADRVVDGVHCVQHDAAISGGNSGGPLINQYGEIIGVNSWTLTNSQNLNFAVSVAELDNLTYGDALTMSQFYEKECDPFAKLKNHIIQKGTYDSTDKEYSLTFGYQYSDDYTSKYTRIAYYDTTTDTVQLGLLIDSDYMILIEIDEVDGVYNWGYIDTYDNYMMGVLYAASYDPDTLLGYDYNNITSSSTRVSVRELASIMVSYLATYLDSDLSSIGLTAEDLGFNNY